ncbi:MAG: methylated-DNA--[protein]-cysteine S-methyltransferase [Ruminococcaceae bacterium]|nr:methylated-DNA--[protein]-cysteine S-methyltransferase [Oscillospiraceae bacterium]
MRQFIHTPIGILELCADQRKLRSVSLVEEIGESISNPILEKALTQLQEYFAQKRKEFELFFLANGTPFQIAVWSKMREIPYGKVVTYGQLAAAIGQPSAVRAVANAVGQNPLLILQPCHRVVASDGLGGFSAGLEAKRTLLHLEGVEISENKAFSEKYLFTFS